MSDKTGIEWTDATWNPLRGCSRVSEGCRHCYAETVAARFSGPGQPYEGLADRARSGSKWTGVVRLIEAHLTDPLKWRQPRRIFVNSMSDLFHESVPDEWIDRIFAVMALAPQHTFQVLTKRPERMREYLTQRHRFWNAFLPFVGPGISTHDKAEAWCRENGVKRDERERRIGIINDGGGFHYPNESAWPLQNVWLGTSVENQQTADARIPLLLQTPAAVRFVSAEPLLGPVNLHKALCRKVRPDVLTPTDVWGSECEPRGDLHWVIVGGESGPGARPCDLAWIRSIVQQCKAAGVACFTKQLGAKVRQCDDGREPLVWSLTDRKGGDPEEWPADLRVREFPDVAALSGAR